MLDFNAIAIFSAVRVLAFLFPTLIDQYLINMKRLYTLCLCFLFAYPAFAQTGAYQYTNKSSGTTIGLHLRADGVFVYNYEKGWTHATTTGKWRPLGSGRVLLNSDYQLSNYQLEEIEDTTLQGVCILIQSDQKGQSPRSIQQLYLNEDETAKFAPDGEASLALLEARQRILTAGTTAERDSLKNTDPPRCYRYKTPKLVRSITLVFDGQELLIPINNPNATHLVLTTRFAPQTGYKYMKDQEFIKKGDYISEAGSAIRLKKKKR